MQQETQEAEAKFLEEHKDEIEAVLAYQQREQHPEGGEQEEDEGAEPVEKEAPPVMPVFNKQEFLSKWLLDNPAFEIPEEVVFDVDNDWILSQNEQDYHINAYFGMRKKMPTYSWAFRVCTRMKGWTPYSPPRPRPSSGVSRPLAPLAHMPKAPSPRRKRRRRSPKPYCLYEGSRMSIWMYLSEKMRFWPLVSRNTLLGSRLSRNEKAKGCFGSSL